MANTIPRPLAVITGASSGLGTEFAKQLSSKGYDLFLVARRQDKLETLASLISKENSDCKVTIELCDLAIPDAVSKLCHQLEELPVSLLVNNAGFGLEGYFSDLQVESLLKMNQVHIQATTALTRAVLPRMKSQREGAIINVASLAAYLPFAGSALYPSSKAFLVSFSKCLQAELGPYSISVQALCPGLTHTDFHATKGMEGFPKSRIPSYCWMSSEEVVDKSMQKLSSSSVVVIPGLFNKVLFTLIQIPGFLSFFRGTYNKKRRLNPKYS